MEYFNLILALTAFPLKCTEWRFEKLSYNKWLWLTNAQQWINLHLSSQELLKMTKQNCSVSMGSMGLLWVVWKLWSSSANKLMGWSRVTDLKHTEPFQTTFLLFPAITWSLQLNVWVLGWSLTLSFSLPPNFKLSDWSWRFININSFPVNIHRLLYVCVPIAFNNSETLTLSWPS